LGIRLMLWWRPQWAPEVQRRYSPREILSSFRGLWAVGLLVVIVMGGIYAGIMPPSAAGTAGALGALVICLVRRRMGRKEFWDALSQTVSVTTTLFLIIIGGLLFSRLLLYVGFIDGITDFITETQLSAALFILFIVFTYLL